MSAPYPAPRTPLTCRKCGELRDHRIKRTTRQPEPWCIECKAQHDRERKARDVAPSGPPEPPSVPVRTRTAAAPEVPRKGDVVTIREYGQRGTVVRYDAQMRWVYLHFGGRLVQPYALHEIVWPQEKEPEPPT